MRLLLTCAAGLMAASCATTDPKSLQAGFDKYAAQKPEEAEVVADTYIRTSPNAGDIDQAYYLRGISRMTRGNRAAAAKDLQTAIGKTTRADLRSKAYRALGDIAFDQQQWADALKNYQLGLDNSTLAPAAATYLNYRIGVALQSQGLWRDGEPWFAKVVAANNDAALGDRAVRRMHATGFALQYGAYPDRTSALAVQSQLKAAGITVVVNTELRADNKLWFLVQSGNYAVWSEAAAARGKVPAKYPTQIVP